MSDTIDRGVSLSDQVMTLLRKRILEGVYAPGERLIEVELAAAFEISRAPLREALRSLAQEGIVTHRSNKGFYVPAITLEDARSLYEFRQAIETSAARWAAERSTAAETQQMMTRLAVTEKIISRGKRAAYPKDQDFHQSVIKAAHSPLLEQRSREVTHQIQLLRQRSAYSHERAQDAYAEHLAIAEAVAAREPEKAEQAMRTHQERSRRLALAAVAEFLARS
jgi:DNA-binding GntR family transcriptional regulator